MSPRRGGVAAAPGRGGWVAGGSGGGGEVGVLLPLQLLDGELQLGLDHALLDGLLDPLLDGVGGAHVLVVLGDGGLELGQGGVRDVDGELAHGSPSTALMRLAMVSNMAAAWVAWVPVRRRSRSRWMGSSS